MRWRTTSPGAFPARRRARVKMCSLCGVLGGIEHWTDAIARPGIYTRNASLIERRRERANRVRITNHVLAQFGMTVSDWLGTSFLLSTRTGKTEIITDLG